MRITFNKCICITFGIKPYFNKKKNFFVHFCFKYFSRNKDIQKSILKDFRAFKSEFQ